MRSLEDDVAMDFRFLTLDTVLDQSGNETTHSWPTKTRTNQPPGCSHTWMMYVVKRPDGGGPEAGGQKRPEDTSGNITQNFGGTNLFGHNRKRGRNQHGLNVWARGLRKGELQEIYGLRIGDGGRRRELPRRF
jgi:hypothetical protein